MNATYLFKRPSDPFHSSESFWTSIFALYILIKTNSDNRFKIKTYDFVENNSKWEYRKKSYFEIKNKLNFEDIIVEGNIKENPRFKNISRDFPAIKPDIIINDDKAHTIYIIGNKTVGANLD